MFGASRSGDDASSRVLNSLQLVEMVMTVGDGSFCACAVNIWPNAHQLSKYRYRRKIWIAESKEGCGSLEFVGWNIMSVRTTGTTSCGLQVAMHRNCHFSVIVVVLLIIIIVV